MCLLVETLVFNRLARKVFDADFEEEQRFFNHSLVVFLSTYALRVAFLLIIICFWCTYYRIFQEWPLLMATVQSVTHLVYDTLPVIHLMMRHQSKFKAEDKRMTEAVMSSHVLDTTSALNQTDNDAYRF